MKTPPRYTFQVRWSNPYKPRAEGQPLVLLEITRDGSSGDVPPEIAALAMTPGYCIAVGPAFDRPRRQMSQEQKFRMRRRNLERRLNRKLPLFAADLVAADIAARPEYFGGTDGQTR